MSSLRRGHANLLCIVPILTDAPKSSGQHAKGAFGNHLRPRQGSGALQRRAPGPPFSSSPQLNYQSGCPEGQAAPLQRKCKTELTLRITVRQALRRSAPRKNSMTVIVPFVRNISVVILIRTDTTLDHSQKAEKVCPLGVRVTSVFPPNAFKNDAISKSTNRPLSPISLRRSAWVSECPLMQLLGHTDWTP